MPVEERAAGRWNSGKGNTMENSDKVSRARARTIPSEDVRARWAWAEASVWTPRMLTALETGVKGGKWHSLIDKVYRPANLHASFARVRRNGGAAGIDHVTPAHFATELDDRIDQLSAALHRGDYRPSGVKRVHIPKPGSKQTRPLGVPTVRDRVVQGALRNVLEPIFERDFAAHSYGFRPNRGCKDALRRVDTLLKAGYTFVVDADLQGYFDTIPHESLLEAISTKVSDSRVLTLLRAFLNQDVFEAMKHWTPESGTPQGAVISPLLSNIYLDPLDHLVADAGYEMVRYADDFVILCQSQAKAEQALALVQKWVNKAGLTLHPEKTCIVNELENGFDFLGYRFFRDKRYPRAKSQQKLKEAIRTRTRRNNGHSLDAIIASLNPMLRGWFNYFQHIYPPRLQDLDGFVRRRLRAILCRRRHYGGVGLGPANRRWPNAFFAEHGLFSLHAAHAQAVQSLPR